MKSIFLIRVIYINALTAALIATTFTSCNLFKKDLAPTLLFADWEGRWNSTLAGYNEFNFLINKDATGQKNLYLQYVSGTKLSALIPLAQIVSLSEAALNPNAMVFDEDYSFGEVKFIRYTTKLRKSDNKMLIELDYLDKNKIKLPTFPTVKRELTKIQ